MIRVARSVKIAAMGLLAVQSLGCRNHHGILGVDKCAEIPAGAVPAPNGSHLCEWQRAQVASASTDLGVFYQADFIDTSDQLGPAAKQHVARMVQQGLVGRVPIVVEPSNDSQRDFSRTVSLASSFSEAGVPLTPDQIQIAYPPAIGLDGIRAQQVARSTIRGGQGNGGGGSRAGMGGGFGGGLGGGGNGGMF